MRLPWDKFCYSDFERDTAVLSNEATGIWIRILCRTWTSPRRGYLLHATGRPFTDDDAANWLRVSVERWREVKDELLRTGVASSGKGGVIFNRRQVRDEETRGKERLKKGEQRQIQRKSLSNHQKCPPSVPSDVPALSRDCPGENQKSEYRSQNTEAAAIAAAVAPVAPAPAAAATRPVSDPEIDYQEVIRNQAMRMIRAHPPPQGGIPHLEAALALRIHEAVNPSGVLAAIEAAHKLACERQKAKPERYWPNAARWVADRDDMKGEPTERRKTIDEDLF